MNVQRFVLEAESEESGQGKDDWWIVFRARLNNKMWTYDFLELKYLCYCSFQASNGDV